MRLFWGLAILVAWSPWSAAQSPYASRDELLDAIERAEGEITALQADLRYDRVYGLVGDEQSRIGKLSYRDERASDGTRSFAIRFSHLAIGSSVREETKLYLFDGVWVTEVIPVDKQVFRRQVVPPGEDFDPLRIGEGPLPIPIGQAKADILSRYNAELVPQHESLFAPDVKQLVSRASQLKLTPKPEWAERDEFREIRLWYRAGADGLPLPVMARTINKQGDESTVRLVGVQINEAALVDDEVFDYTVPPDYDLQITPWREGAQAPSDPGQVGPETWSPVLARTQPEDDEALNIDPRARGAPAVPEMQTSPAPAVASLLQAGYLTADEAKDLRVFHGFWAEDDLDSPARRARAALIRGDPSHPSFDDPGVPPVLAAEAALMRGEHERVLELLDDLSTLASHRIRAESAFFADDPVAADRFLDPLVRALGQEQVTDASELVEGVRGLMLRARLRGPERDAGSDYTSMSQLLAYAREQLDRLYWPAVLAEAELLYDKDNRAAAYESVMHVLRLNPASARAWAMLAELSTDRLATEDTEKIVQKIDHLAIHETLPWTDGPAENGQSELGRSMLGAMALARARLRQDDPESAIEILNPIVERFPEQAQARGRLASAHATAYDLRAADELLESFEQIGTGHYETGRALSERRQYADAARYLEEAAAREPHWAAPWVALGLLETQAGRDDRALLALERAFQLDPFNLRADNTLRLLRKLQEFPTIETEHFVIRFQEGIDRVLAEELPLYVETMHERVAGQENFGIDHEPTQKTVIELMPDHQTFSVRIVGMPRLHTNAAATGPVIAMETPRESPKHTRGPYDWLRVLTHEYTHTVTLSRTSNRLPLWFTEASAQLLEDAPMSERTARLLTEMLQTNRLFDLDEINVRFTRPVRPFDRELAYAQGLWMYQYITETWGARAPLELMDAYAAGARESEAFREVLELDREPFMAGFFAWARAEATEWGLVLTEGVPELGELVERDRVGQQPTAEDLARWLGEYPDHPQVLELAGSLISGIPDEQEASLLRRWQSAVPIASTPHRLLARFELEQGTPESIARAIAHLEFLDAREISSPAYAAALAERYVELGRLDLALGKAERATLIAPYDPGQRDIAARVALAAGDYASAERHLLALTRLEPDRPLHERRLERIREIREREL